MNWRSVYSQIAPGINRSRTIYKRLFIGTLISGVLCLLLFLPLGIILLLVSGYSLYQVYNLSKNFPYVLEGVPLKKEKLEYEFYKGDGDPVNERNLTTANFLSLEIRKAFYLTPEGEGKPYVAGKKVWKDMQVSDAVYNLCLKNTTISLVISPDKDMLGYVSDGKFFKQYPLPVDSKKYRKLEYAGTFEQVLESHDFS